MTWTERDGRHLILGGSVTAATAASWRDAALAAATVPIDTLDLADLELEDGVAVVEAVNLVTALRDRAGALRLLEPPQMLAHTLYKVGALTAGITLVDPRSEDGTTAN